MALTTHHDQLGFESREAVMHGANLHEMLHAIDPELWTPAYGEYSRDTQVRRLDMIHAMVGPALHSDREYMNSVNKTYAFVDGVFDIYEGKTTPEAEGSFAFVVPSRIERKEPGEFDDYADEANFHMPMLAYVDSATRQNFMAGLCPFIIDKYGVDPDGKRGYMVFAPLLGDIVRDLPADTLLPTVDKVINDTTDFAKNRLGVSTVGLGAILPRLTDMGRTIRTPELITTTGHGGTVALILRTLERGYDQGMTRDGMLRRVGIIGSGAIGAATADVVLSEGLTNALVISDRNEDRLSQVISRLSQKYPAAKIEGTTDNVKVVNSVDAAVSAVTTQFNLDSEEWKRAEIDGLYLIDDSQPGAFNPDQFEKSGGIITWVMGHDGTPGGLVTLGEFDYVGTGPASKDDIFGCQGEVAAIYLAGEPDAAINTEVSPEQALKIDELFNAVGIGPAAAQRLGKYVVPSIGLVVDPREELPKREI